MKKIHVYIHIAFLALYFLATYFYLERIICMDDCAFYMFKIINKEGFNFEASRYGVFLSQILPIIGIKLKLSLRVILMLYSVSFILLFYVISLLMTYIFKAVHLGIALILLLTVSVSYSFFHAVTETYQAIAYALLFHATIFYDFKYRYNKIGTFFLGVIWLLLSFFSHPIGLFFILFSIGYYFITTKGNFLTVVYYIVFLGCVCVLKLYFTDNESYEGAFFSQIKDVSVVLANIKSNNCFYFFGRHLFDKYLIPLALSFWTFFVLARRKEYLKLTYIISCFIGYCFVLLITFNKGDSEVMMEKVYVTIFYFSLIPFSQYIVIPKIETSRVLRIVLIMIFIFSLSRIYSAGEFYKENLSFIRNMTYHQKINNQEKLYATRDQINSPYSKNWGLGVSTLLYSSLEGDKTTTLFVSNDTSLLKYLNEKDLFLCVEFWPIWRHHEINNLYFKLPDKPYVKH